LQKLQQSVFAPHDKRRRNGGRNVAVYSQHHVFEQFDEKHEKSNIRRQFDGIRRKFLRKVRQMLKTVKKHLQKQFFYYIILLRQFFIFTCFKCDILIKQYIGGVANG